MSRLCADILKQNPEGIKRCEVGHGNYVCIARCEGKDYVVRCNTETGAYDDTIFWLGRLKSVSVPVPEVIAHGRTEECEYLILEYIEGEDLGEVYPALSDKDKRCIAREVAEIQQKAAQLQVEDLPVDWAWGNWIVEMLDRAESRILAGGYFDVGKVSRLREEMKKLEEYFSSVEPIAYLDDISTKNLLINNGRVSGVIDVDWIGVGDRLTFAALTGMALLNMELSCNYVDYLLDEMQITTEERRAFLFYKLIFCVDFMGERGMQFFDKRVEVNDRIIDRLNGIYDSLWGEWLAY